MKSVKVLLATVVILATLFALSGSVCATDWKVDGQTYWIQVNEFFSQDGLIHGNGSHGVIKETGFQSGVDAWYTRPSIEVYDAATGGNLLSTVYGVCIDTADFVGSTRHESTLLQGWAASHSGISHRYNGTVMDAASWARTTYMASQADWGIGDSSGVNASAFQLGVWELMSGDGSLAGGNFTSGNFRAANVSGALLSAANSYVTAGWQTLPNGWTGADGWYFHNTQDFLIYNPDKHDNPVPEIPASLLAPLGLSIVGLIRRRARR